MVLQAHSFFNELADYDFRFLRLVQENRIELLDSFMYFLSYCTTYISLAVLTWVLAMAVKQRSGELKRSFFLLLCAFSLSALSAFMAKLLVQRERPFLAHPDIQRLSEAGSSSFPSGHTMECFAVALTFSALFPKSRMRIPLLAWAFVTAYSRLALGVHYPFDILAGMLLGIFISQAVLLLPGILYRPAN